MINTPKQVELPAFSICFFYKLSELKFDGERDEQTAMTLGQINFSLPTWEDYVMSCEVLSSDYKFQDCLEATTNFHEYLSLFSKCYTLFENQQPQIVYDKNKVGSDFLINVILNVSKIYTNNIGVYLTHSSEELGDSLGNPSFVQFDSYLYNRASITFERTLIQALPWPYSTRCFNYTDMDCKLRETCIKRCILEQSWHDHKGWVDRRYVKLNPRYMKGRFGAISERNITTHCNSRHTRVSCREFLYNSIVASQIMSPFKTNDTYQINIAFPLSKFTDVQYVGVQNFIEYICYVTSIISLWTEISVIRIAERLFALMIRRTTTQLEPHYSTRSNFSDQNLSYYRDRIALNPSKNPVSINYNKTLHRRRF